jgi:hypothetical protein
MNASLIASGQKSKPAVQPFGHTFQFDWKKLGAKAGLARN